MPIDTASSARCRSPISGERSASVPIVPQLGHFAHNSLIFPHMKDYRENDLLSALAALLSTETTNTADVVIGCLLGSLELQRNAILREHFRCTHFDFFRAEAMPALLQVLSTTYNRRMQSIVL
jgi:hypothetical protein